MFDKILRNIYQNTIPTSIANRIRTRFDSQQLAGIPTEEFNFRSLRATSPEELTQVFGDRELEVAFLADQKILSKLELPESTGGVNLGDQKAIYFLIRHFKPRNVLEVGTFVGCSTVHIALALKDIEGARLTTVDINDVNDEQERPWEKHGAGHSPSENVGKIGCQDMVSFHAEDSRRYLSGYEGEKYDFVFLDGNHDATFVYYEVAQALKILSPGGVILLHDYFPGGKSPWKEVKRTIPGPHLAVDRIMRENQNSVSVLPLGQLPWKTKMNSHMTTLAILSAPC